MYNDAMGDFIKGSLTGGILGVTSGIAFSETLCGAGGLPILERIATDAVIGLFSGLYGVHAGAAVAVYHPRKQRSKRMEQNLDQQPQ